MCYQENTLIQSIYSKMSFIWEIGCLEFFGDWLRALGSDGLQAMLWSICTVSSQSVIWKESLLSGYCSLCQVAERKGDESILLSNTMAQIRITF